MNTVKDMSTNSKNDKNISIQIEYKDEIGNIVKIEKFPNCSDIHIKEFEEKLHKFFLETEGMINTISIKKV